MLFKIEIGLNNKKHQIMSPQTAVFPTGLAG